ncbi:hypothetical protein NLJ89_g7622 [Agrocybe chaxingu]|uniref:Adhesin domain-containing protein n=1 Tax=Agrocybe chaxingu TaxID=84603 RepID=A0A9W8MV97_9AGAR|nr:hypothetical protein NLJ89_g7622 [Agrocybe chaxingu]
MSSRNNGGAGFSFLGMVAGAMAALKLKSSYDQYKQVSPDDEEGRPIFTSPSLENLNAGARRRNRRVACAVDSSAYCTLFWKAVGVVLGLYTLYFGYKAIRWALTDTPSGLEGLPEFGSVGCTDASYTYNNTAVTIHAPIGTRHHDHALDVRGYAVGTITIADGALDSKDVKYEILVKTNSKDLEKDVAFDYPYTDPNGIVTKSRLIMDTTRIPGVDSTKCMKYDIKVFVPPNLKKLQIGSHSSVTHVQFAPGSRINTDDLFVTLYDMDEHNVIVINEDVKSKKVSLEVIRGWIVGDVSVVGEASITTQRGDGKSNIKFHPALPFDTANPEKVAVRTVTGAGRSDFAFIGRKETKRPIDVTHMSSRNGDLYLTYKEAEFNGKVELNTKSYTVTGARSIHAGSRTPRNVRRDDDDDKEDGNWTHYVGDKDGGDKLYVNSRGWAGLYF